MEKKGQTNPKTVDNIRIITQNGTGIHHKNVLNNIGGKKKVS